MAHYTNPTNVTGVLTAFDRADNDRVVHWSTDGKHLGSGDVLKYYNGASWVRGIIPYNKGVITYFQGDPNWVAHWSPNGETLAGGPPLYLSSSRIFAMTPFGAGANGNGVLTHFELGNGNNVVCWSSDGTKKDSLYTKDIRYQGAETVWAMLPHDGGVLTSFS
jgi:hypothetical protein